MQNLCAEEPENLADSRLFHSCWDIMLSVLIQKKPAGLGLQRDKVGGVTALIVFVPLLWTFAKTPTNLKSKCLHTLLNTLPVGYVLMLLNGQWSA